MTDEKKTQGCGCTTTPKTAQKPAPPCACGESCRCGDGCRCAGCSHAKR